MRRRITETVLVFPGYVRVDHEVEIRRLPAGAHATEGVWVYEVMNPHA